MVNTDWVITAKHTLSESYFYSNDPQNLPFSTCACTPGNGLTPTFNSQVAVLKLTSALNGYLLNEALIGYIRSYGRLQTQANLTYDQTEMTAPSDPTYPLMPITSTTGYFQLGGVNNDVSFSAVNTFEISDQISWTHGKQSIRAGFLGEKDQFNFDDPTNKRGSVTFQAFQDFLLGMSAAQNGSGFSNVNSSGSQQGSYYKSYRGTVMAMFIQGDIKLRPNLTVNAGLRWELNSGVSANHGQLSSFYPSLVTPFQPVPAGGTFAGFVVPHNYRLQLPAGVTRLGSMSLSNIDLPLLMELRERVELAWWGVLGRVQRRGNRESDDTDGGQSSMDELRVLIAHDHDLIRRGVRDLLAARSGWRVVGEGEACTGTDAVRKAVELKPDIAILDFSMPELNGPAAAAQIAERVPETGVVVLTMHDSDQVMRKVLQTGAHGLVLKSDADRDLLEAVEAVAKKRHFFTTRPSELVLGGYLAATAGNEKEKIKVAQLTERECEVVRLLADGMSSKEAATRLQISIRTVESHRININRKLGLNSIAKLVRTLRCSLGVRLLERCAVPPAAIRRRIQSPVQGRARYRAGWPVERWPSLNRC
jgi:DNA-binding NarL/FixJ family response regulator